MGWGTLLAWLGSLTIEQPLGAVGGVYFAWRHPEYSTYAASSFSAMGAFAAIPLTWHTVGSRVSHFRTFLSDGDSIGDLLLPDPLTLPNLTALILLAVGIFHGGWVYTLPTVAFWMIVWALRVRAKERTADELKAVEKGRYPLADGSTLVVQSIDVQDHASFSDPDAEGRLNSGLTFISRVNDAAYVPGGTLWITWRQENSDAAYPALAAYLCDVDAPEIGVYCPSAESG